MPGWNPGWRWQGRWNVEGVKYEKIKAEAEALLEKATKGDATESCCGALHIPLVVEGKVIGELREDVEIKDLEIGAYKYSKRGIKVQLMKDGRVVGFLWLQ